MSVVYLVRHGQASFGRSDYDKLSPLGEEQARMTGAALAGCGVKPALLVTGSLQRQRVTGSRMWEEAGWEAPVDIDEGWNEYDHDAIVYTHKPAYTNQAVMQADLARRGNPRRAFQEMFVEATGRWTSGEHDDYDETFAQFADRIMLALGRVTSRLSSGQDAVVVSSGGPISWVASHLLTSSAKERAVSSEGAAGVSDASVAVWHNLSATTVNASVTKILVGRTLTALTVNDHSHLQGREGYVTYR